MKEIKLQHSSLVALVDDEDPEMEKPVISSSSRTQLEKLKSDLRKAGYRTENRHFTK